MTASTPTRGRVRRTQLLLPFGLLLASALLPSCTSTGNFCLLGYTTDPNYDRNIRTVRVPIFKNYTMRDSTRQGIEFDLTRAVVREIELNTPYKVVGGDCSADTELTGTITRFNKLLLNRNQLNEVREAETTLAVEVVWKDLRTGEVLSQAQHRFDPVQPPLCDVPNPPPPPPVLVTSVAGFIPELGESMTTARQKNVNRLAVQIVNMMEKPW
jgi:hypothetical protein